MILRCGGDGWTAGRRRLCTYSLLTTKRPKNKAMIGRDGALKPGCFSQSASRRLEHLPDFPVNLVICTYTRGSSVVLVPPPLMRFLSPWVRVKRLWLRIPCSRLPLGQSASGGQGLCSRARYRQVREPRRPKEAKRPGRWFGGPKLSMTCVSSPLLRPACVTRTEVIRCAGPSCELVSRASALYPTFSFASVLDYLFRP